MRVLAEDIAKRDRKIFMPLDGGGREEATSNRNYDVIALRPHPEYTPITFWAEIVKDASSWHGGFAEIQRAGRKVEQFNYIHPSRVVVQLNRDNQRREYVVKGDNGLPDVTLPWEDMIHIHGVGYGLNGCPFIRFASESLGLSMAAQRFSAAFYGNGMHVQTALKTPNTLGEKAVTHLRESWGAMHAGARNSFTPAILEEGLDIERIGVSPEEGQNVEQRQFQIEEACRFWRVAPQKVQHLIRATFNNVYELNIDYEHDSLGPWFKRIEQELHQKVLLPSEQRTLFISHVRSSIMRGSLAEQGQFHQQMFNVGALTINELRDKMDMNPIGHEGDVRFINGNMAPVEQLMEGNPAFAQGQQPANNPADETPPALPEQDEPDEDGEAAQVVEDGFAAMLSYVAQPMVTKEAKRMAWAANKYASDPDGYREELAAFWGKHKIEMEAALFPAAHTMRKTWEVSKDADLIGDVSAYADRYCILAQAIWGQAYDEGAAAELAAEWRRDKAMVIGYCLRSIITDKEQ